MGSWTKAMLVVVALAATTARADEGDGWTGGLRLAYGSAMGDAVSGIGVGDLYGSAVPIWFELGRNVRPNLFVGVYGQYGFGQPSDTFCPSGSGLSCSGRTVRAGAEVVYRLTRGGFVPWVGAGFGYEWASLERSADGARDRLSLSGFELLNLQVGGDYAVAPRFKVGPFVAASFGRYGSLSGNGRSVDVSSSDKSFHSWLQLGVRGTYDF
jgi:hypothetical protein